jgi:uncharacterized protein YqgQ
MTVEQKARQLALTLVGEDQSPEPLIEVLMEMAEWQRKQMVKEIVASVPPATPKLTPRRRCKNDMVQFEVRSMYGKDLKSEYDWCAANLPLKEERGLVYQVTEFYIITRSQRIIDKVNRHFGSSFSFKNWQDSRIFYID